MPARQADRERLLLLHDRRLHRDGDVHHELRARHQHDDDGDLPDDHDDRRAVQLLYPAGSNQTGTSVCLSRITGGCVAQAHLPFCSYVHLHGDNEFGIGIDGNGPYRDPEYTQSEPCGFGAVTTVPGCGPDSVPPC